MILSVLLLLTILGANSGIGVEVSAGLMEAGAHVVLGCRNDARCAATKRYLDSRGYRGSCECSQLDLSDFDSVRAFSRRFDKSAGSRQLQVLVNNAGVMGPGKTGSQEIRHGRRHRHLRKSQHVDPIDDETTTSSSAPSSEDPHITANHLGPYLLTRSLIHRLGPGSRVVTVASEAHVRAPTLVLSTSGIEGNPSNWYSQYARSKLLNVLMSVQLEKELQRRDICACTYAVSPGRVNTGIFDGVPWPLNVLLKPLASVFFKTPAQGAATVLHAALATELEGRSVAYLHEMKPARVNAQVHDADLAQRLWDVSEILVGGSGSGGSSGGKDSRSSSPLEKPPMFRGSGAGVRNARRRGGATAPCGACSKGQGFSDSAAGGADI